MSRYYIHNLENRQDEYINGRKREGEKLSFSERIEAQHDKAKERMERFEERACIPTLTASTVQALRLASLFKWYQGVGGRHLK